MKLDFNMQQF